MPSLSDFRPCIPIAAGLSVLMQGLAIPIQGLFRGCVKGQANKEEVELRSQRAADFMVKAIYKIASVSIGFYILKDTKYFPRCLGGSGDYNLIWEGMPYPSHTPYLKEYYISCTSYHAGVLFNTIIGPKRDDFVEMMLHHSVTVYLLFGSYMMNVWECGIIISYLHDFSDITAHMSKMWSNTTWMFIGIPNAVATLVNWFYCRCYILPYFVYNLYHQVMDLKLFDKQGITGSIYIYLLSCLVALHYFWFYQILKIVMRAVFKNDSDDFTDKVHLDKKKNK